MERVETLLKKLQEQFAQNAPPAQLLLTVQMLQAELLHLSSELREQADHTHETENVTITVSHIANPKDQAVKNNVPKAEEEKIVEVLKVDEAEIEAELEEIKRNAEAMQKMSAQNKPYIQYQPEEEEDIPTLSHQAKPKPEPCLLYTSPSPRDRQKSRMPSSA